MIHNEVYCHYRQREHQCLLIYFLSKNKERSKRFQLLANYYRNKALIHGYATEGSIKGIIYKQPTKK